MSYYDIPVALNEESIETILLSHELAAMPTNGELRSLTAISSTNYHLHKWPTASYETNFFWAHDAAASGARVRGDYGMLLGSDGAGREVWASLVYRRVDLFVIAALHRALVQIRRVVHSPDEVSLEGLQSLDDVASWHAGIRGNSLAERFAFVYDALVTEAKGTVG